MRRPDIGVLVARRLTLSWPSFHVLRQNARLLKRAQRDAYSVCAGVSQTLNSSTAIDRLGGALLGIPRDGRKLVARFGRIVAEEQPRDVQRGVRRVPVGHVEVDGWELGLRPCPRRGTKGAPRASSRQAAGRPSRAPMRRRTMSRAPRPSPDRPDETRARACVRRADAFINIVIRPKTDNTTPPHFGFCFGYVLHDSYNCLAILPYLLTLDRINKISNCNFCRFGFLLNHEILRFIGQAIVIFFPAYRIT